MDRRPGGWKLLMHLIGCSQVGQNWVFTVYLPGWDFHQPSWPLKENPLPRMAQAHDFTIQMGSDNKFL